MAKLNRFVAIQTDDSRQLPTTLWGEVTPRKKSLYLIYIYICPQCPQYIYIVFTHNIFFSFSYRVMCSCKVSYISAKTGDSDTEHLTLGNLRRIPVHLSETGRRQKWRHTLGAA